MAKLKNAANLTIKFLFEKYKNLAEKVKRNTSGFHALHSSLKWDHVDYTFKFSTELIVLVLSFIVIGTNLAGSNALKSMNSSNLFAKFLSYHPYNQKLYSQSIEVKNVVLDGNNFIHAASANVVLADLSSAPNDNSIIDNNSVVNPNPDSVRTLIADEIKTYTTVKGDTLQSIAKQFNISVNTIIWSNNLKGDSIKPGTDLVILPTDGVLHKVTNNDTLPDIAREFSANINDIISYNNLVDDSDINPGDLLIIPNGSVPAPKPKAKPAQSIANIVGNKIVYEPAPGDITEIGGQPHLFPVGQCTYYVAMRRNIPWGGNAKQWLANAAAYGAKIGRTPIVGAIMVSIEGRRDIRYGHVALVEQINGDNFMVSEMNYKGRGIVDQRWISVGSPTIKGFIY